jgi:hypothetical protein
MFLKKKEIRGQNGNFVGKKIVKISSLNQYQIDVIDL